MPIGNLNEGSPYLRDENMARSLWDWTESELKKHGF
jgi:hypothetical protein